MPQLPPCFRSNVFLSCLALLVWPIASATAGVQATFLQALHDGERPVPRSVLVLPPLSSATLWSSSGEAMPLPAAERALSDRVLEVVAGDLASLGFRSERAAGMPFNVRAAIEECIQRREPQSTRSNIYSPRNDLLEAGRYRLNRHHTADLQRAGTEAILYVEAHAQELSAGAKALARDEHSDWSGPRGSHAVIHWWLVETRGGLLVAHGQARRAGWVSDEPAALAARVVREALEPFKKFESRLAGR